MNLEKTDYALPSNYEVISVLGQGGMGVVLHVVDKLLERQLAIKLLLLEGATESKTQERFLREGKTLAKLNHPNIVKLLRFELNELGQPFMVMEYIEGTPLSAMLTEELSFSAFINLFTDICAGLNHAHELEIVHRDLKPTNIMVCRTDEGQSPKIIDFGIALLDTPTGNLTGTSKLIGTPAYMSPEQCKAAAVDKRSDIFSLGCIMYEALTGRPPFSRESAMQTLQAVIGEDYPRLAESAFTADTRALAKLIDSCLAKDPSARPSIAEILAQLKILQQKQSSNNLPLRKNLKKRESKIFWPVAIIIFAAVLAFGINTFSTKSLKGKQEAKQIEDAEAARKQKDKDEDPIPYLQRKLAVLEKSYSQTREPERQHELVHLIIVQAKKLASTMMMAERYTESEAMYNHVIKFADKSDDKNFVLADVYSNLAELYRRKNDLQTARQKMDQAWNYHLKSKTDETFEASSTLLEMSFIDLHLDNLKRALEDFNSAKRIMTIHNFKIGEEIYSNTTAARHKPDDSRSNKCMDIFRYLRDKKKLSDSDRVLALEFRSELLEYYVLSHSVHAAEVANDLKQFLPQVPALSGKIAIDRANQLLSDYEKNKAPIS